MPAAVCTWHTLHPLSDGPPAVQMKKGIDKEFKQK